MANQTILNLLQGAFAQLEGGKAKLLPKYLTDLVQINIKSFRNDETTTNKEDVLPNSKQISIISDIERIRKVVEILEFVGSKVEAILEKLPAPQAISASANDSTEKKIEMNGTEIIFQDESETNLETTSGIL